MKFLEVSYASSEKYFSLFKKNEIYSSGLFFLETNIFKSWRKDLNNYNG